MTNCLLCQRHLAETTAPFLFLHDEVEDCLVRVADVHGISVDDHYEVRGEEIYPRKDEEPPDPDRAIEIVQFYPTEHALKLIFAENGLERLGGQSTGSGWSNVSLFQKCPYRWKRRYVDPYKVDHFGIEVEILPLAIGTLVHTYLAIYYKAMITPGYPITPEIINRRIREMGCNPDIFEEGWRLFINYRLFYKNENIQPLEVEFDLKDPRTNHSCRFDLIAFVPEERPGMLPGTWAYEHKTAQRFTADVLEAWPGDGEILGQVDLWDRLHLDKRFGPLRGVVINLLGKQKTPEFHRTIVSPTAFTIEQHRDDLRNWNAKIALAKAIDDFPRSRNNCIGRYGRCELWDHCNSGSNE